MTNLVEWEEFCLKNLLRHLKIKAKKYVKYFDRKSSGMF